MAALMTVFARFRPDTTGFKQEAEAKLRAMNLDAASGLLGKRAGAVASKAFGDSFGDGVGKAAEDGFAKDGKSTAAAEKSGKRSSDAFGKGFADRGGTFARVIATMVAKTTVFGAGIATATTPVLNFTAALLPATGALLAVPAALAAASAAAFTFKAATDGVGKAISKGLGPGGDAYEKALDLLTPAQRKFTEEVVSLGDALTEMNDRAAQPFFEKLIGQVRPLADIYLPLLGDKMAKLAPEISQIGLEFINVAKQGATVNTVASVFDKTSASVKAVSAVTGPATIALRDLLDATINRSASVSAGFQTMALRAAAYVSEASKSGAVNDAIDSGITVLKDLGAILRDVGFIFGTVFNAATAGSNTLLGNLRSLVNQTANFFSQASTGQALTEVFSTLNTLGAAFRTSLGAVLPAIATSLQEVAPSLRELAPVAAQLVVALAPLLPYFVQLTNIVIQALIPGLAALVGWLSRNEEVAKVIATVLGGLVLSMKAHAAATAVSATATRSWAAATAVAATANKVWNSTFVTRIRVWAIDTAAQIKNLAATSASTVAIGAQRIAMVASTVATRIAAISTTAFGVALRFAMGPIGLIITAVALLAAGIVYLYKNNETFRKIVDKVWAAIKVAVKATADFITGTVWPALKAAWSGIAAGAMWLYNNAIKPAWSGIQTAVGVAVGLVKGYISIVSAVFRTVAAVATWLYQNIFSPVFKAIAKVIEIWWFAVRIVFTAFKNVGVFLIQNTIRGAQKVFQVVFGAIVAYIQGWWAGVKFVFGLFTQYVVGPWVRTVRAIGTFFANVFTGIANFVSGWWRRIRDYFINLKNFWTTVFYLAANALRDKINNIVEAVRARVAGWVEKIRGYFNVVANIWRGLASIFTDAYNAKIKPLFDRFLGFINKDVVGGFRTGVKAIGKAWEGVRDAAKKPVAFVVNSVINPFIGGLNAAAKFVGLKDQLPKIAGFAGGGRIPGPDSLTGDNRLARIKGTGKEIAVATGEFINNVRSTRANRGLLEVINRKRGKVSRNDVDPYLDGYADGGSVGDKITGFFGKVIKGAKGLGNFVTNPGEGLKKIAEAALSKIPGADSGLGKTVAGAARKTIGGIGDWLKDKVTGGFGLTGGNGSSFGKWPSSPGAQRGDSGVWRRVVQLIRSTGPMSGAFGNGYRPGDPKWHGSGRAVDWMGFNQDRLATYLARLKPLELIHRTNQRDYAYTRGRNRGSFNNALMQAHRNHIHIAFKLGGLVDKLSGMMAGFRNGGPVKLMDQGGRWPSGTVRANQSGYDEHVLTGGPGGDMAQMIALLAAILDALGGMGDDVAAALSTNARRGLQKARSLGTGQVVNPT